MPLAEDRTQIVGLRHFYFLLFHPIKPLAKVLPVLGAVAIVGCAFQWKWMGTDCVSVVSIVVSLVASKGIYGIRES